MYVIKKTDIRGFKEDTAKFSCGEFCETHFTLKKYTHKIISIDFIF